MENSEASNSTEVLQDTKNTKNTPTHTNAPLNFEIGTGNGQIFGHSLAFPSTFGQLSSHFCVASIIEHWNTHSLVRNHHYQTFGEVVSTTLMDNTKSPLFAEGIVITELNKKISQKNMVYSAECNQYPLDWHTLVLISRKIGSILGTASGGIGIQQYQQITAELGPLNSVDRIFVIRQCERRLNFPLPQLAAQTDTRNVKYVMSQLKLLNLAPLLHQLFAAPTITGKITAIMRIFELYDMLWKDISWISIEKIAEYFLQVWDWLMCKTEAAKTFAESGFSWVKARFSDPPKAEGKLLVQPPEHQGADQVMICSCGERWTHGCSSCGIHVCNGCLQHRKCNCSGEFIHALDQCECANNQDCLWRALAAPHKISVASLKRNCHQKLRQISTREQHRAMLEAYGHPPLDFDEFYASCIREMKINEQAGSDIMVLYSLTYRANVWMFEKDYDRSFEGEPEVFTASLLQIKEAKRVTAVKYFSMARHYEPAEYTNELRESYPIPDRSLFGFPWDRDINFALVSPPTSRAPTPDKEATIIPMVSADQIDADFDSVSIASVAPSVVECPSENGSEHSGDTSSSVASKLRHLKQDIAGLQANNGTATADKPTCEVKPTPVKLPLLEEANLPENSLWQKVATWFKCCARKVLVFFQENPIITGLMAFVVGIGTLLGISVPIFKGDVVGCRLMQKLTESTRTMYYAERSMQGISDAFHKVIEVSKDMLGISRNQELDDFRIEVNNANTLAREMLSLASTRPGEFVNDISKFHKFKNDLKIIQASYDRLARYSSVQDMQTLLPIWQTLNRTFEKLHLVYNKTMSSAATRQEPVVIYLFGETGIGKSMMTNELIARIKQKQGRDMAVFTISKGPDYWNGFAQQEIIRIDDMNSAVGPEGDLDSLHVFNLATNAPYNPNMAALEDKNIMCTAKYLIICSNHPTIPSNSIIQYREAWERRRDIFINVRWPEHEKCNASVGACNCYDGKNIHDFSHLQLLFCDPNVSTPAFKHTVEDSFSRKKQYVTMSIPEIQAGGQQISFEELVDIAVNLEKKRNAKFMDTISEHHMTQELYQATSWKQNPHVFLMGPPGTGKSYILDRFCERMHGRARIHRINTQAEFDDWADSNFVADATDYIVIDDLTRLTNSKNIKSFFQRILDRYGDNAVPNDLWIIGMNRLVAETMFDQHGLGMEYKDAIYRRAQIVSASFKRRWGHHISFLMGRPATYTVNDITDNTQIGQYVEYKIDETLLSQESVIGRLCTYTPVVVKIVNKNELKTRQTIPLTCALSLDMSEAEFLKVVNTVNITNIIHILRAGKAKTYFGSKSKLDIASIVFNATSTAKNMLGTDFDSIEEMFLQVWNTPALLQPFKGECFVLSLNDKKYYCDYTGVEPECGILLTTTQRVQDAIAELDLTCKILDTHSLNSPTRSILPHWLVLTGEILSTAISIISTSFGALYAVKDQQEMYNATRFVQELSSKFEVGYVNMQEGVTAMVERKLESAFTKPYDNKKLSPGPSYPRSAQLGDIVSDNPYESFTIEPKNESHDNPNKIIKPRWRPNKESGKIDNLAKKPVYRPQHQACIDDNSVMEYCDQNFDSSLRTTGPKLEARFQCATPRPQVPKEPAHEMCRDPSFVPISNKILENMCEIISRNGERICSGLFIRGSICRTVLHIEDYVNVSDIRIRCWDGTVWPVSVYNKTPIIDCWDLRVDDPRFPLKPDISNHFPSKSNSITEGCQAILITPEFNPCNKRLNVIMRSYVVHQQCIKHIGSRAYNSIEYKGHRVGYQLTGVNTKYGDCGSILILCDQSITHGKVIGMHTAGTTETAFASPLIKEHYDDVPQHQAIRPNEVPNDHYFTPVVDPEEPQKVAVSNYKIHIPNRTRLFRNWFPYGPELYQPSILSKHDTRGDGRPILKTECMKWCTPRQELPDDIKRDLTECMYLLAGYEIAIYRNENVRLRVLTSTEALNKVSGVNVSEPINIKSSAGYPWNLEAPDSGKRTFISVDERGTRRFNKSEKSRPLVSRLHNEITKLEHEHTGKTRSDVIFQVFLKDELVKNSKITTPKTRTIAAAPLHFVIPYRKYFFHLDAIMMEHWTKLSSAVGINPQSYDWHFLTMKLLEVSTMGGDLDFAGWDFSHPHLLLTLVCEWKKIIYSELDPDCTEEDQDVRDVLYSKLIGFLILVGEELFRTTGGIASGYPSTSTDNTRANWLMLFCAWMRIMKRSAAELANLNCFNTYVACWFYGDDLIMAISDLVSGMFNLITISAEYEKFGFKPQAADKTSAIVPLKPVHECIFLSRKFKLWGGIWLGPLLPDHLAKPTHFCHDRRTHRFWESPDEQCMAADIVQQTYESVLYNAALESKDVFYEYWRLANKVNARLNQQPPPEYHDVMSQMFGVHIRSQRIQGLIIYDASYILHMDWHHALPQNHKVFRNRTSYSFGPEYSYTGSPQSNPMPRNLKNILAAVNSWQGKWNSILVNIYPVGGEIPYHKDNEPCVDQSAGVAGLTLTGNGRIVFKNGIIEEGYYLKPGEIYRMDEFCLKEYQHKRVDHTQPTVSFTFRKIKVPELELSPMLEH